MEKNLISEEKVADRRVFFPVRAGNIAENEGTIAAKNRRGRVDYIPLEVCAAGAGGSALANKLGSFHADAYPAESLSDQGCGVESYTQHDTVKSPARVAATL